MPETDPEREKYEEDSRTPCKYGVKCYQKNAAHLSKYKHPPQAKRKYNNAKPGPSKKIKLNDDLKEQDEDLKNSNAAISEKDSDENMSPKKLKKKECVSPSESEEEDETEHRKSEEDTIYEAKTEEVTGSLQKLEDKECVVEVSDQSNKDFEDEEKEVSNADIGGTNFDPKQFIKSRFLVDLPKDFYDFWTFCTELKPNNPTEAFKAVGLTLVGPYDVLAGKFKHAKKSSEEYLLHWRYYYDPPEMLTVLKGDDKTGYHVGYFYDSPNESPPFLVSNHGTKDGVFTKMGNNIFASVSFYLEELKKTGDPFKKMQVGKFLSSLKTQADKLKLNMSLHSEEIKKREKQVVAKTFNKIGLVVPYNRKTQLGYRDLTVSDKELMALLNKIDKAAPEQKEKCLSELQPVLTYANIAIDECDFGTGIKLGWELLFHGTDALNSTISRFLSNSYKLLQKEAFAKIAEAHMKRRKKGCNLSIM
ncbi:hypothetical protein MTP99_012309 [Tenebrio molitor]|nr:hypothetical protein MTP99_012309 [Tenebrio molitor]